MALRLPIGLRCSLGIPRCAMQKVEVPRMREEAKKDLKPLEIDVPRGVTVHPGRAAEILGVSVSSLKKRASEWGLHTFWEANGGRYSLIELEAAKLGVLEAVGPVMIILDFDSIAEYFIPDGYGGFLHIPPKRYIF